MVQPEFKPFTFNIDGTSRFCVDSGTRRYIDFSGSAMTVGYDFIRKEDIVSPVSSLVFKNRYTSRLVAALVRLSGFENAAFTTSGTEACDVALGRYGAPFIAFEGAYHGLSHLTDAVSNGTGIDRRGRISHLLFPAKRISDDDAIERNEDILKKASKAFSLDGGTIIMELIQSDGGVNVASGKFIRYVSEVRERYGMRLVIDEVYTGMGRSGELFLFKKYGLEPDMVCIGKGMAAGLPLGAVLYNGEWGLPHNNVVSMQSANMMSSKVALRVLDSLKGGRLAKVRRAGAKMIKKMKEIGNGKIYDVRGMGFMIGIDLAASDGTPATDYAYEIREGLARKGLICSLVGNGNNVVKVTPPVLVDGRTLEKATGILVDVLSRNGE